MQLDAALHSFFLHCQDADQAKISVLYMVTDDRHASQYKTLKADYPRVAFIEQTDFRRDVLSILSPYHRDSLQNWIFQIMSSLRKFRLRRGESSEAGWRGRAERIIFRAFQKTLPAIPKGEFVLFLVDDNLFVRDFKLMDAKSSLESTPRTIGFSLRLGINTTFCYTMNQPQAIPSFLTLPGDMLKFKWTIAQYDFNYPLELSSSIYPAALILALVIGLDFRSPNELEAQMATHRWLLQDRFPILCCYPNSVTFCNPVNVVQSVFPNRAGGHFSYSIEELASRFERGESIKVEAYANHTPSACHEEVELIFSKEKVRGRQGLATPLISVVMPVYNGERFLAEAIESILNQTLRNFEFIIVDDASTDNTPVILEQYSQKDRRIISHRKHDNEGIVVALNTGLKLAHAKYIARMDQDDISLPERLDEQVGYLELHPEVGLLGSQISFLDQDGIRSPTIVSYPGDDLSIRWAALFYNPFAHPAMMFRRALLIEHALSYDPAFQNGEDYHLWSRMLRYTSAANLKDVLLLYRLHSEGMSQANREAQRILALKIAHQNLSEELSGFQISFEEIQQFYPAILRQSISKPMMKQRTRAAEYYLKIWQAFYRKYRSRSKAKYLARRSLSMAAKLAFYPLFQQEALKVGVHLTRIDPFWVLYFLGDTPSYLKAKLFGPITYRRINAKKAS
jgi:glycosyltransferase involved in cell wall biosynthesis